MYVKAKPADTHRQTTSACKLVKVPFSPALDTRPDTPRSIGTKSDLFEERPYLSREWTCWHRNTVIQVTYVRAIQQLRRTVLYIWYSTMIISNSMIIWSCQQTPTLHDESRTNEFDVCTNVLSIYLSVLYLCYNAMSVPTVSIESTVRGGTSKGERTFLLLQVSKSPSLSRSILMSSHRWL